ncbi:MAG: CoA transferase, partial [Pseudomonadota bacterium]
ANLPPKALARLGLEEEAFRERYPQVVLATQTGFGLRGPDKDKGGFDGVGQALSGAMYLSGVPGAPMKAAAPYVDFSTAVLSALGVLAALMARDKTGRGQHVDTALLGTALSVMGAYLVEEAVGETGRVGTGNRVQTSAPSDVFATKDGNVLTHVVGDGLFARWARLIGEPDLADRPDYRGDQSRGDARDALCAKMADWCAERTTEEAVAALEDAGVPCGPVLSPADALSNPQVEAMGFLKPMTFPGLPRPAPVPNLPIRFSDLEAGLAASPPAVGA